MAKYIIEIPDEVPVSDELVPFDMCRPSWYWDAYEKGKADAEKEKEDETIKQKVIDLANDIGIHKLYSVVVDIRGE